MPRTAYTPAERLSDATVHVIGVALAVVAVPVLIALALVWHGQVGIVLATLVYGGTLMACLGASALYHMVRRPDWRPFLRRLDHSAIYWKIAGTYTPFVALTGGHGGYLLAGLWGAAAAGTWMKLRMPGRFERLAICLYLAMGWAGVLVGWEIIANLSATGFQLMLTGGLLYTGGVAFYLLDRMPFHNTLWHVCVLAATGLFFAAVTVELGSRAPLAA